MTRREARNRRIVFGRCSSALGLSLVLVTVSSCDRAADSLSAQASAPSSTTPVSTVVVEPESVTAHASLPADLKPVRRATLAAEVPGAVESLTFEESSWVRAGQQLLAIDTRSLEQAVAEAEALDLQAQTAYATAERLLEKRAITHGQYLEATTNRDVVGARLASARLQLEKSRPVAPWSGRVSRKLVEVGDYVVPGQPIAELVDVSVLEIVAPASASDAPYLALGTKLSVVIDGFREHEYTAEITRLGAELDPNTRTLQVTARLPNPDGLLRPGMTGRVTVPRQHLEEALLVPLDALVELGEETAVYVVVHRENESVVERRTLELGPIVDQRIVVRSGLAPGDRVVVEGRLQVTDGQAVREAESSS